MLTRVMILALGMGLSPTAILAQTLGPDAASFGAASPALALVPDAAGAPGSSSGPAPAQVDPIRELLEEVRGLRAALERAATIGARIQLLVARVQIQEQRIADLTRRVDSIRAELRGIEQQMDAAALQEKMISSPDATIPPEQRAEMEQMMKMFSANSERLEKRRQELALEEGMVAQQIALDQGRWNEINSQLDELDRALTKR